MSTQGEFYVMLGEALNAETARQNIGDSKEEREYLDNWRGSGSGFGYIKRPIIGTTLVEIDYDFASHSGELPRWVATVWRNGTAYDADNDTGHLARFYCDAPPPSACGSEDAARVARFAVGVLRMAPSVEIIHYAEAQDS